MTTQSYLEKRHQPNGRHREVPQHIKNVGDVERLASIVGGGLLGLFGLSRQSLTGLGLAVLGGGLVYRGLTGHCQIYDGLGINTADRRHGAATSVPAGAGIKVEKTIIIYRSPEDMFHFWRNLENLPRFMRHLESVINMSDTRSRWVAKGPLGMRIIWDAEIINEKPNELIAWRSLKGAKVDHAGSVHFRRLPADGGTEVHVVLKYDPPAGKFGATIAKLLGDNPEQQIQEDLRSLKRLIETGEIPFVSVQPESSRRF